MAGKLCIGLDFDNTIITYDEVFLAMARAGGLISADFSGGKREIRDAIRVLPDGERCWQQLQGQVYGKGIASARLFHGVDVFLRRCSREHIPIYIVSHKTEIGHYDPDRINLRDAARHWMTTHGFFRADGYRILPDNVFFEDTRQDKLNRIASLGCTQFVDDLEEVLSDPAFPSGVERILFNEGEVASKPVPYTICPTWQHVEEQIFRARV